MTAFVLTGLVRDGSRVEGALGARDQAQDPRGHQEELRAHGGREDQAAHRHSASESCRKGTVTTLVKLSSNSRKLNLNSALV